MTLTAVTWIGLALLPLVAVAVLTGVGCRRRGDRLARCIAGACVFPVAWVLWYLQDDLRNDWHTFRNS